MLNILGARHLAAGREQFMESVDRPWWVVESLFADESANVRYVFIGVFKHMPVTYIYIYIYIYIYMLNIYIYIYIYIYIKLYSPHRQQHKYNENNSRSISNSAISNVAWC